MFLRSDLRMLLFLLNHKYTSVGCYLLCSHCCGIYVGEFETNFTIDAGLVL